MSWSRRLALLAAAALLLPSCGFEPLYGRRAIDGVATRDALASVRVRPIAERTGQLLYNALRDRLNPRGKPIEPRYALEVTLDEASQSALLQADATTSRIDLTIVAHYSLRRVEGGDPLTRGSARATGSYDIGTSEFANLTSAGATRERIARDLGHQIANRLAIFFHNVEAVAP